MLTAFKIILLMIIFCSFVFAFGDKDKDKRPGAINVMLVATLILFLTFLVL